MTVKVYAETSANIIMEGTDANGYFAGDLEAFEDDGKISVRRRKHDNIVIAEKISHTEFLNKDGNSFGDLQETIDGLNEAYNETTPPSLTAVEVNNLIAIALLNYVAPSSPSKYSSHNAGRVYMYADNRWISSEDDNYGSSTENYSESSGTGVDPIVEWEHLGMTVSAGTTLDRLVMVGRVNNLEVLDIEIRVIKKVASYDNVTTGFDNDNESVNTTLLTATWKQGVIPVTDKVWNVYDINHTFDEDCEISIYYKPVGVLTATRYLLHSYRWDFTIN